MGKKPILSVTYKNERISIKNSLPYIKCVLRLSWVVDGPIYGHPRRPRGSQSGREKRREESFQVRAKEPLGTDSHWTISKNSSRCRLLIGQKKNASYYCAQSANTNSRKELRRLRGYTTTIVAITACLDHAPKKCTQSANFQFDIKSPSDFKILSARKLKTLFQKYKLELTKGIHACIGHVLRNHWGVFKRYHDG